MPKFEDLSRELTERMEYEKQTGSFLKVAFDDRNAIRRHENIARDRASIWRQAFVHDIDKIMHSPYYNRYADKTQVYSLCKNDDLTRRNLHVQLVSRISRTIGSALNLNLDLIEAISLGHDIGHPPFAHTGEKYLDRLYFSHTGRHFMHNIQSVRVLDQIFPHNITLQTLNDIAAHNGEIELQKCVPQPISDFETFDRIIEQCYLDKKAANSVVPCSLEGAVVRASDIIAYLGKDRQDAIRTRFVTETDFYDEDIGSINSEIINNLVVNIIENSYGKNCIMLDEKHFAALQKSKKDNYEKIYNHAAAFAKLEETVKPMMTDLYEKLLDDVVHQRTDSLIYTQHINIVNRLHYNLRTEPYENTEPNQIVVDYIASMTDNYFVDLHQYLFPNAKYPVVYRGYFDDLKENEK